MSDDLSCVDDVIKIIDSLKEADNPSPLLKRANVFFRSLSADEKVSVLYYLLGRVVNG